MEERLMRQTAVACLIFALCVFVLIFFYHNNKEVLEAKNIKKTPIKVSQEELEYNVGLEQLSLDEIFVKGGSETTPYILIPIPESVSADTVLVENKYETYTLNIKIASVDEAYFRDNRLSGNSELVEDVYYGYENESAIFHIKLNQLYESVVSYESGELLLYLKRPQEVYDKIVMLDAASIDKETTAEVSEEKVDEWILDITRRIKEQLEASNIKTYCTRRDNIDIGTERREQLVAQVNPDILVSFGSNIGKGQENNGLRMIYNGTYFIPNFDSGTLAGVLAKEVAKSIQNTEITLEEAAADTTLIYQATVPAVQLGFGNVEEKTMLEQLENEEYRKRVAAGVVAAIQLAYEEM